MKPYSSVAIKALHYRQSLTLDGVPKKLSSLYAPMCDAFKISQTFFST